MTYNSFDQKNFLREDAGRIEALVKQHKAINGIPTKVENLRKIAKTKRKTVTPEGWKWV